MQGVFNGNSFKVTNVGYVDRRVNRIKKVKCLGVFKKRRVFTVKRVKGFYLIYYRGKFEGVMKRFNGKRGWWKIER